MAVPIRKCYKYSVKKYILSLSFVIIINRIYIFFFLKLSLTQFPFRMVICTNLISEWI